MIFGYRVEDQVKKHGLWRNFDGTWNPVFDQLSEGLSRSLPMEDSELYREKVENSGSQQPHQRKH